MDGFKTKKAVSPVIMNKNQIKMILDSSENFMHVARVNLVETDGIFEEEIDVDEIVENENALVMFIKTKFNIDFESKKHSADPLVNVWFFSS